MKFISITLLVLYNIYQIENRMLLYSYTTGRPTEVKPQINTDSESLDSFEQEKLMGSKVYDEDEEQTTTKKPCAIVVLSNVQNPTMQSLLRRYRYDSKGVLIPSSVKYFIKLPQGVRESPILVPLNDKSFSPLGGFVRYYKEVPPIPHTF